ncbi:diguanylate cyclase (GGDEF)-like protein [Labrenzia sp. MBR-25]
MTASKLDLTGKAIDMLFPMHVVLDDRGRIGGLGPTLERVLGTGVLEADLFDVFTVERPRNVRSMADIRERLGTKLVLRAHLQDGAPIQFRGFALAVADEERIFLDLSFGLHLSQVVERFGLTEADFKPNDFSIDLFYSFEAQRTLLEDSQKMASALKAAKIEAEKKASQDPLTEIANRGALHRRLEDVLHLPDRGQMFALLHIDLDEFKSINDNFGHSAGDMILLQTAEAMTSFCGPNDLPARLGGDEFALFLAEPPDKEELHAMALLLLTAIAMPIRYNGHSCQVTASIGVVLFHPGQVQNADRLIAHSDIALYDAKTTRSSVKLLSKEMIRRHEETSRLISLIERGLKLSQFVPYFQPQIDSVTGRVCGLEVVARWQTEKEGVLPPARFLETATRANIMSEIDQQVRCKAFTHFAQWKSDGTDIGKLSLNVTASNLRSEAFAAILQTELADAGLTPGDIQLELLESILFDQSDQELIAQCRNLEQAGFALALDDFGTGHSSIATLIETPVATLKIDRSFVSGLDRNPKMQRIAGAMLAMAQNMGLDVLAEGVETREELEFLENCGCRLFQGFYFSPPLGAVEIRKWLDVWAPDLKRVTA